MWKLSHRVQHSESAFAFLPVAIIKATFLHLFNLKFRSTFAVFFFFLFFKSHDFFSFFFLSTNWYRQKICWCWLCSAESLSKLISNFQVAESLPCCYLPCTNRFYLVLICFEFCFLFVVPFSHFIPFSKQINALSSHIWPNESNFPCKYYPFEICCMISFIIQNKH